MNGNYYRTTPIRRITASGGRFVGLRHCEDILLDDFGIVKFDVVLLNQECSTLSGGHVRQNQTRRIPYGVRSLSMVVLCSDCAQLGLPDQKATLFAGTAHVGICYSLKRQRVLGLCDLMSHYSSILPDSKSICQDQF